MEIQEFKNKLKENLCNGSLRNVFQQLLDRFDKRSVNYNTLISLVAEHKNLDDKVIAGTVDYTKENLHLAQIRGRLLRLIDNTEPSDYLSNEQPHKDDIEIGLKELPTKVLISMGKMTLAEVKERLNNHSALIEEQNSNLKNAREQKEILALEAMNKLKSLQKSRNSNIRIYKKYLKDFVFAFKGFDKEIERMADVINRVNEDAGMLCLFQIQSAFEKNNFDLEGFEELLALSNRLISQFDKVIPVLNERIEKEKLNLLLFKEEVKVFEIKSRMKKSINAKILLKDSFIQFADEWQTIHDVILLYHNRLD